MFLEFRVRNFRSFREEAVLSMAASADTSMMETHTSATGLEKIPRVVNSAAVFGANASGKSNFVKAIAYAKSMVTTSTQIAPDKESNLAPFRMRDDHSAFPTMFEFTFVIRGTRYQYGFEVTRTEVHAEWLLVYEKSKPQVWFSRSREKSGEHKFTFSDYFMGSKKLWESATRKEVLFLTTAIQLNNGQLKELYQAIGDVVVFEHGSRIGHDYSAGFIELPHNLQRITKLLNAADTGISAVSTETRAGKSVKWNLESNETEFSDAELKIPHFGHAANGQTYDFELGEESMGTQTYFGLLGPLLNILDEGQMLVIDELDSSLHPLLVQEIVGMFHDPTMNKNGAQLLFTTHDVTLMDSERLRRDQIWLTEKDRGQVSHLFPLLDFSPRKGEALERNYMGGRYGGIPILERMGMA